MKFRILSGAAMMVASSVVLATGLVGTTSIASANPVQHAAEGVHVHRW